MLTVLIVFALINTSESLAFCLPLLVSSFNVPLSRDSLAAGMDLGGTSIKAGLVTEEGVIAATHIEPLPGRTPEDVLASFTRAIEYFVAANHITSVTDLLAAGVCAPGECESDTGMVHNLTNFTNWRSVPLAPYISDIIKRPVALVNDGDAACVGEWWAASQSLNKAHAEATAAAKAADAAVTKHKELANMCLLTLGTGVGCGIVSDGSLVRGMGMAAEFGHILVVDPLSPLVAHPPPALRASAHYLAAEPCNCGQHGCLEKYTGADGITRLTATKAVDLIDGRTTAPWLEAAAAEKAVASSPLLQSLAAKAAHFRSQNAADNATFDGARAAMRADLKVEAVFAAARGGDPFALFIEDTVAALLAVSVLTLVRTMDTQAVYFGGGASLAGGAPFVDKIRKVRYRNGS